jgi:DNA-binding NarL/FixJ family response regulator
MLGAKGASGTFIMPEHLEQRLFQLRLVRKSLNANTARLLDTCAAVRQAADLPWGDRTAGFLATQARPADALAHIQGRRAATELALLTKREIAVLKLIAEGYSTKELAHKLGITFKTASCHRFNLMRKLNVKETATLVRLAIRTGLVQP